MRKIFAMLSIAGSLVAAGAIAWKLPLLRSGPENGERFREHVDKFIRSESSYSIEFDAEGAKILPESIKLIKNGTRLVVTHPKSFGGNMVRNWILEDLDTMYRASTKPDKAERLRRRGIRTYAGRRCEFFEYTGIPGLNNAHHYAYCFDLEEGAPLYLRSTIFGNDHILEIKATGMEQTKWSSAHRSRDRDEKRRTLAEEHSPSESNKAKAGKTMGNIRTIATAALAYSIDENMFPVTGGEVYTYTLIPTLTPTYLEKLPEKDGWGNFISYEGRNDKFCIRSPGRDGVFERSSCFEYPEGKTHGFDEDIFYRADYSPGVSSEFSNF